MLCLLFCFITSYAQIRPFRCIYLHYTSLETWTDCCDILRCNPSFQVNNEERFDCVAINMDDDPLTFGRLLFLFQCRLPSGRTEDITLVRLFKSQVDGPRPSGRTAESLKTAALSSSCLDILCAVLTWLVVLGAASRIAPSIWMI
jgi:hypothetical protein